ncbi:dc0af46a-14d8-4f75-8ec9-44ceb1a1406d-CDS [Sclerotinia trifoliorum]|uniref:Dc0af46a-14d8-4f75-8ec9-44ceb1a1406d-CDS n=1 Tax=Sclerotinia trifoliorum TaxID=28548 RepID=A0A8H2VQE0_9HELO|nr:dc0af46a-14d8-4f75-8ec9-44ceb1a1406d-CDS [Sclerotinia trifoliorum]
MTNYCQSSLLSDSSSPRLGVQTSYSCDTTSQNSPALFFVSPLGTPYNLITRTTSSSDISATSSTTFGSEPTPGSSFTSAPVSSSEAITPQETTVSSNRQANSPKNHTGAIIGGAIGGVTFITFLTLATWLLHRHRKNHKPPTDPSTSSHDPKGPDDNIHELMEKNGHTPEIGGTMVMAEADSPSMDRAPVEMHGPVIRREPVEMEA